MSIFWYRMGLNSKRSRHLSHQFCSYFFSSSGAMISVDRTCNYLIPKKLSLSTTRLLQSCVALQLQPRQFGSVRFFAAPSWAKKTQDKDAKVIHINEEITAQYVRLVTDEGHEVITRRDALYRAKSLDLDLVEVGSKADPPVCKIMDFNKEKFKKVARDKGLAKTRIHSRKRNRLNSKRFDRLVYIIYNRKLHERTERHKLLELDAYEKYDPIRIDSINCNSEWVTSIEGTTDEFVYTEADGFPKWRKLQMLQIIRDCLQEVGKLVHLHTKEEGQQLKKWGPKPNIRWSRMRS